MPSDDKYVFLDEALQGRKSSLQYRKLHSVFPGEDGVEISQGGAKYINFSGNDYLGLSRHPEVVKQARLYLDTYGAGSSASRLITGSFDIHNALEQQLAKAFNRESALVFNSGFQANSSILRSVTDRHSLLLADKLSHNSLLQGSLASRASFQRYNHNDVEHLEALLQKAEGQYNRIWIITETVFSMDGDRSPVQKIANLADTYNALLFVDDAHAAGVWGENGLGLAKDIAGIDILLGTCGKAFGSFGAYVVCSKKMKNYLVNFCPGFIFTTALPPAVIGATHKALEIIPSLKEERQAYHRNINEFREAVQRLGFDTGPSTTQIIPLIIGDENETLALELHLKSEGIYATAIRPPTVPEESSRIRITLTARHTEVHINRFLNALKNWKNE